MKPQPLVVNFMKVLALPLCGNGGKWAVRPTLSRSETETASLAC